MRKIIVPSLAFLALAAGLWSCQNGEAKPLPAPAKIAEKPIDTAPAPKAEDQKPEVIHIGGVGDIMMGSNYPSASSLPPNDGKDVLADVREYLLAPDIMFGNLEGVLLDKGGTAKACGDPKYCFTFRMPQHYAGILKDYGFDVMSVANNHASDFGDGGRASTAATLKEAGIHFAGSVENPVTTFVKDNVKYGFCAFSPNKGCMELKDYAKAAEIVRELDKQCDIVIVSFHGGAEGEAHRHTPCKDEVYLGANRGNVCKFAHTCIDAGADILFGHGPHVTRGVELYKGRFITYSMGNFCTYEKFGISNNKGLGPIINLKVTNQGEFIEGFIVPTKQHGKGIPKHDPSGAVIKEMIALSKADFPSSPLEISTDGKISIRK